MKIYNINIDTSKPANQVVPMQQNDTGLLNLNVTNGGKYIRNLTTKVYDGETEVPSTEKGFKIDVGAEPKQVKIEAKSEPIICQMGYFVSISGAGSKTFFIPVCQPPIGVYSQDEFKLVVAEIIKNKKFYTDCFPTAATKENINIDLFRVFPDGSYYFARDGVIFPKDEPIVVTGNVDIGYTMSAKRNSVVGTYDYPAFGYYTDYQMDTTIKPSSNAPYDGNYVEPLKEVEVDGVKFVPTTLTIDGVEYKVLAEAQEVDSTDTELDSTDTELDSNASGLIG